MKTILPNLPSPKPVLDSLSERESMRMMMVMMKVMVMVWRNDIWVGIVYFVQNFFGHFD